MSAGVERGQRGQSGIISVVMACHNGAHYLEEGVASVLGQSYPRIELVVVDDGSTDGSWELLSRLGKRYPRWLRLVRQENRGPYPARNTGLRRVRGELVAFLDADDYWDRECLRKLEAALAQRNADLVYCGWLNVGRPEGGNKPYVPPEYGKGDLFRRLLQGCPWPIHAALVRREIIERVGGFSERYFSSMDYDLWLRICAETQNIVRVPEVLAFYRWHSEQISSRSAVQAINSWRVRRDFVRRYGELVAHIEPRELRRLTAEPLLRKGYAAYWRGNLATSRTLFRQALWAGGWEWRELKHLLPSLLPEGVHRGLLALRCSAHRDLDQESAREK